MKSVYGYHIIQALGAVKPAHTQTFAEVKSQIEANLASQQKQTALAGVAREDDEGLQGQGHVPDGLRAGDDHDADDARTDDDRLTPAAEVSAGDGVAFAEALRSSCSS